MKQTAILNVALPNTENKSFLFTENKKSKGIINSMENKPKIAFMNYLLFLVEEKDRKENSLYLKNVDFFIEEIWNEIIRNNFRKLNVRKMIPNKLGISYGMLYSYKNGKKGIPIQTLYSLLNLWKDLCNKSEDDIINIWNRIFNSNFILSTHSKYQEVKLPKFLTPKLSYIIGWICGDGHLKQMHNYLIKISEKSVEQLMILKILFKEVFNVKTPIFRRYKGGYAIQIGSKAIYRFLNKIIKIKVGEIPKIVYKMDKINKKYFLAGIFDSEGYVCNSCPNFSIVVTQSKKFFLIKIIDLYNELGIPFRGPYFHKNKLGEWYTIQIKKKIDILKFYKLGGSYHIDKLKKLEMLVSKIA